MTIKLKDEVVMKAAVIKRTNHSAFAKNFKGIVVNIVGKTADVQTSAGVRSIPTANLTAIRSVYDARTEQTACIIID
jgi:hypothetical protein